MASLQRKPQSGAADPLAALRAEIDSVDAELVRLFARRFKLVRTIGGEKAKRGIPVVVPERIQAVQARIAILVCLSLCQR